jgi:chloramphenicol O-acetyltransferase
MTNKNRKFFPQSLWLVALAAQSVRAIRLAMAREPFKAAIIQTHRVTRHVKRSR